MWAGLWLRGRGVGQGERAGSKGRARHGACKVVDAAASKSDLAMHVGSRAGVFSSPDERVKNPTLEDAERVAATFQRSA